MRALKRVHISRIDVAEHRLEHRTDYVAEEKPLHILLNRTHYVTILCLPTQVKDLAVGHLFSEGIVKSIDEIQEIKLAKGGRCQVRLRSSVNSERRMAVAQPFARLILSSCGSPDYWPLSKLVDRLHLHRLPLGFTVKAETIQKAVRQLNKLAEIFRRTGGVHIAALYSQNGELIAFAEDVGRHNAVDKVIGANALKKGDFSKLFLASSGRLTGDVVLKAARMQVPVVASLAAAVDSGIEVAKRTGLTLIGFVRGTRMNLFTHPERIIV